VQIFFTPPKNVSTLNSLAKIIAQHRLTQRTAQHPETADATTASSPITAHN